LSTGVAFASGVLSIGRVWGVAEPIGVEVITGVADPAGATAGVAAAVGLIVEAGVGDAISEGPGKTGATAGSRESCPEPVAG